jgi:hypothetical protein
VYVIPRHAATAEYTHILLTSSIETSTEPGVPRLGATTVGTTAPSEVVALEFTPHLTTLAVAKPWDI